MRAVTISQLKQLLEAGELAGWYARYRALRDDLTSARSRASDPLLDGVLRAGNYEDLSARATAEFAHIENDSFELLSAYETQRQLSTDAWSEHGGADKLLEDLRAEASEARAQLEAIRKQGRAADAQRLEAELAAVEERVASQVRQTEVVARKVTEATARKEDLWRQVEATWSAAFRANLARTVYAYMSRRTRAEAEQHARNDREPDVGDARRMAERVKELEGELERLMAAAGESFGCAPVGDFLFWPCEDDVESAFCVPLIDEADHLNLQVRALGIYRVERAKGLEFLEPVPEEHGGSDDPRLDAFFLQGRPAA